MFNPQMKQDLKDLAARIRNGKTGRKPKNRNESNSKDFAQLANLRHRFRHLHIAYCLMRGRRIEQIEVPAEDNLPNKSQIDRFIEQYTIVEEVEQQEAA